MSELSLDEVALCSKTRGNVRCTVHHKCYKCSAISSDVGWQYDTKGQLNGDGTTLASCWRADFSLADLSLADLLLAEFSRSDLVS